MYYTYILKSDKSGRYYIGHTLSINLRLTEHNSGRVKSTRNKGPWQCVYFESFETRLEANRRELEIKNKKSRKYIEYLLDKRK